MYDGVYDGGVKEIIYFEWSVGEKFFIEWIFFCLSGFVVFGKGVGEFLWIDVYFFCNFGICIVMFYDVLFDVMFVVLFDFF